MTNVGLDQTDRKILNQLQHGFPICPRPYEAASRDLGITEAELIDRLGAMLGCGLLSRFGPLFDAEKLGGAVTLVAMNVPEERYDAVAEQINAFPEVAHNYARDHDLNMWFVLATETPERIAQVLAEIAAVTGLQPLDLPKEEEYFLELKLTA